MALGKNLSHIFLLPSQYLQRARTFGFTNLPLSLQLQNETLKADISAGGDGVEQISKTAKRMLQERMRKEKEKLRNAQQKSSGRHWVAALNRWVRDDKVRHGQFILFCAAKKYMKNVHAC